jgi:hypothetical protein
VFRALRPSRFPNNRCNLWFSSLFGLAVVDG